MERCSDVLRFASLGTTEQESGTHFRIDYLKPNGAIGFYHPDWVAVQKSETGNINWIIETKGFVWEGTEQKDAAMKEWCKKVSEQTKTSWQYSRVNQIEFGKGNQFSSFQALINGIGTKRKRLSVASIAGSVSLRSRRFLIPKRRRDEIAILRHYWRPTPKLSSYLTRALEESVDVAARESVKKIYEAVLSSLRTQDINAKPRERILQGRKFEDDIRVYAGNDEVSIEVENDGNRLEFDLLKMMTFAETVPKDHRPFGCLIIPANKQLGNPYISGSGKERIWDYVTVRLLPMILPVKGLRLENILVLGYERANQKEAADSVSIKPYKSP